VGQILEEPLLINSSLSKAERREKALAMMAKVGLKTEHYDRYPHMFSGGQRQRIAIARGLMLDPDVVIADEPVSALDVSVRAQVLNLMMDLQQDLGLSYVFISHDLSVVEHIADEVMVMYLGRCVEKAPRTRSSTIRVIRTPGAALCDAAPEPGRSPRAYQADRRAAEPAESAAGLRV
jgi:dipeptide transport system ATP-binding protein